MEEGSIVVFVIWAAFLAILILIDNKGDGGGFDPW